MQGKPKIACLLGKGYEDSEFKVPYERFIAAGFQVEVIGQKKGEHIEGKHTETALAEKGIDEVNPQDYDALFIPGGYSPDHLRADPRFVKFVQDFDRTGKLLAVVCHGPQLLMSAGLVKGRTLTAWKTVQEDLKLAGANVKDEAVVKDRNWISSRHPGDLEPFSEAVIKSLR